MNRRQDILDALLEIFSKKGVSDNFTMKELAEKANIGKSTIYEYFETKEDLLEQAVNRLVDRAIERIYAINDLDKLNFEQLIKRELSMLLNLSIESQYILSVVNVNNHQGLSDSCKESMHGKIMDIRNHYEERFKLIFLKGIEEGLFTMEDAMDNHALVNALIAGSVVTVMNDRVNIDESDVNQHIDKIYQGILKLIK